MIVVISILVLSSILLGVLFWFMDKRQEKLKQIIQEHIQQQINDLSGLRQGMMTLRKNEDTLSKAVKGLMHECTKEKKAKRNDGRD